jgi:hypothetical protein
MCRRLAEKTGVRWSIVTNYFNGEKDNYVIARELPDGINKPVNQKSDDALGKTEERAT